jgi:hypothetical protein
MVFAGVVLAVMLIRAPGVKAHDDDDEESLVKIGFEIAPVPLKFEEEKRDLVGLGSFIVNAQGDCNGCHTGGLAPNFNYANNYNPYFGQKPAKDDPRTYLSGGTDFGPAVPPSPPRRVSALPMGHTTHSILLSTSSVWFVCRSKHDYPQLDTRQNWAARRRAYAGGVHDNPEDRQGL